MSVCLSVCLLLHVTCLSVFPLFLVSCLSMFILACPLLLVTSVYGLLACKQTVVGLRIQLLTVCLFRDGLLGERRTRKIPRSFCQIFASEEKGTTTTIKASMSACMPVLSFLLLVFFSVCLLTLLFWSYLCLTGPFNYISLYESLLQS